MVYEDLKDAVVLITGGATGIGAAMVEAFARQQAIVHFCDINVEEGKAFAKACGERVQFKRVDVRKERQLVAWIDGVAEKESAIHVMINNAAKDTRANIEDMTVEDWDRSMELNLRPFFVASQRVVRHMPPKRASIISMASITFYVGFPNIPAYVSAKGGVVGMTRAFARELGPKWIRVNAIAPGWVATERQKREVATPALLKKVRESQCMPDYIQPEEIADVALFLASRQSSAITGQCILAARGWAHA